ncbi:MAG TPA: NADPH:quinone reductase [Terriglobia bacterium]|nr:NADPH:quinone reductase [Terriglobia bacterium]
MKAIRVREFGPPGTMKIEEVSDPAPGPGQVVVAIRAAGVNPVDTYVRAGTYARKKPDLPYTPGFDGAGIVESVGAEVTRVKPGDRVYINGTLTGSYAEKALCPEGNVYPLPPRLTFAQGAGVYVPYATAAHAIFHVARCRPAETILIHGASGGVGTAATQIAKAAGMRVIGTAGTPRGLELVTAQGAHFAINHRSESYAEQIAAATGGRGPDVILEMLANVNLARDLTMAAFRGRIVVIGNRGTIEISPRDAMAKDVSIHGMMLLNITPDESTQLDAILAAGLENGVMTPVVGREFLLAEAARAHEAVLEPGAYGKIVLVP